MKVIITESQADVIKNMVKTNGLAYTANLLGGFDKIVDIAYGGDIKELSLDTDTELVWISSDGMRMFIHEVVVDRLGLESLGNMFRPDEKELGNFYFGSKNGSKYSFTARVKPTTVSKQPYYKVVGTSGDYGFGYGFISQKNLLGKRYRGQIFQQIIDKYNLSQYM